MKQIIWVYGPSAVGKETFIKQVVNKPPEAFLEKMGWAKKKICYSSESLMYIGQIDNDPIEKKREAILKTVPQMIENCDIVLIKAQDVDLRDDRPGRLRQLLPKCGHSLVYLVATASELAERLPNKTWWDKSHDAKGWAQSEINFQKEKIRKFKGFVLTQIESPAIGDYRVIQKEL